jgi:Family of unknown function (DUF5678)
MAEAEEVTDLSAFLVSIRMERPAIGTMLHELSCAAPKGLSASLLMHESKGKAMSRDEAWITAHFEELVEHYGGKYVGIAHCRVIAVGDGADEVAEKARGLVERHRLHIVKVPTDQEISWLL